MIPSLLNDLIAENGGDGAGIGTVKDGKAVLLKGMTKRGEDLQKFAVEADPKNELGWLFHTRAKSIGPAVESLVQPVETRTGLYVHNGHWMDWEKALWALILMGRVDGRTTMNDSYTIAETVAMRGPSVLRWVSCGVHVWWNFKERRPLLYKSSGVFAVSSLPKSEGGGIVYASTFPYNWPVEATEVRDRWYFDLGQWLPPIECQGGVANKKYRGEGRRRICGLTNR